jgi:nucleoside-diphosphate-sugar epimerase
MQAVILGCGYTGQRVAARLLKRGLQVVATTRTPASLAELEAQGAIVVALDLAHSCDLSFVEPGARVLYSIPTINPDIVAALDAKPARLVYLSTTGVYGDTADVDHTTTPCPRTPREVARVETETTIRSGPWSTAVLRPAAIYGPGRGIHISMLEGRFRLVGDGSNYVSRIHVDDLAAISEAVLLSDIEGAWPVADEHPCPQREIAEFCSRLLRVPMPLTAQDTDVHETRRSNRRVDGRAILKLLGLELLYPSYRQGIPGSLAGIELSPG